MAVQTGFNDDKFLKDMQKKIEVSHAEADERKNRTETLQLQNAGLKE